MSKKEKSFRENWKNFFRRGDFTPYNFDDVREEPYSLSLETLKDISPESSTTHRLKALRDLCDSVLTKKLADYTVEAICKQIEDLISAHHPPEVRSEAFQFYCVLIHGQVEHMYTMRSYLFRIIISHNIPEDIVPRFEMLDALTDRGKTITYFEEEIGPFLLHRFLDFMVPELSKDFLTLVTNVIKFNAAYLDDNIIEGFVEHILRMCRLTNDLEAVQMGLNILEAILCYSHLPGSVLKSFICILCVTVNREPLVESSWKQMRNLLGTNLGIPGIYLLCQMLQEMAENHSVLRGVVFFLGKALWGSNRIPTLNHPPNSILPSFLKVLDTNSFIIAQEVLLALRCLIIDRDDQLEDRSITWDAIFEIVERLLLYPEFQNFTSAKGTICMELDDFITVAEEKCPSDSYESLFKIVDNCSNLRNEQSVIRLILYKAESIKSYKPDFISNLNQLLEKFFKNEKRPLVQLEVIKIVRSIREINVRVYDDDIDQVILQNLSNADSISDVSVRKSLVDFLIVMAEISTNSYFLDILDIIEKVLKRMLENLKDRNRGSDQMETSYLDSLSAAKGLIYVFKRKLFLMPPNHCVEIFSLLVKHMQQHYQNPSYHDDAVNIRKLIFEFFFEIRANRRKQVGVLSGSGPGYSVYLMCDSGQSKELESVPSSPSPASPSSIAFPSISYLSFDKGYQIILTCLKEERDWRILEMVFKELPILLQNKSLIIRSNCNVATLCSTLWQMVDRHRELYESLKNTPPRFTRTDFQGHIFPCAAALTSYHSNLESYMQRVLIRCLQCGLVSRSAKTCMEGLTLCILEMQDSMIKLLPDVLLKFSKISATKIVGVSVLEFLSNLIRLPHLYVSFVEDQYMSIFAIALPYTNPFKFNQYTVALAHHVLSMWFLKCRIPFRRDFAKFITKGLRSNIKLPRDENRSSSGSTPNYRSNTSAAREENKNSSSLTDDEKTKAEESMIELHTELMETGLDLMARFTFGMCTNLPQRSPVAEFLLERGQKTSWLVGNKIVTITTSGCGTKSFKHGLCERCYSSSHEMNKELESDDSDSIFVDPVISTDSGTDKFLQQRKRHRSAIPRTNTTLYEDIAANTNKAKDDITLHYTRFQNSSSRSRRHTSYVPDTDRFSSLSPANSDIDRSKGDKGGNLCSCWCTSWAEVHVRRPTGNTSWMMKMQNQLFLPSSPPDVPLSVLHSLVLPQLEKDQESSIDSHSESETASLLESELKELSCEGGIEINSSQKSTPPMRRTNSSPDMNTGWFQSLELGSKQPSLEDSTEFEKDQFENQQLTSSVQSSSLKQRLPEKTKRKNLKLNLASFSKDKSSSAQSSLQFERESLSSAPLVKRQFSEVQQSSSANSFRDRGHTISVMSPIRPSGIDNSNKPPEVNQRNGMSPSFVFLQLFHNSTFGLTTPKPLLLPQSESNNRTLTILDHTPPYDTHKIGIVYVGRDQVDDEVAILSNVGGSSRYVAFLRGLGRMVKLAEIDPHTTYLGGLDTRGEDGDYGLIWHDDVMQVVFHVATFMKNKESDKMRNEKKKHIANDCVMIVYNESGEDFKLSTIKGQVTNACVIVKPEDFNCNVVSVKHKTKELMEVFGHTESYIVSDNSLPVFVRQMALHANLASVLISRRQHSSKYTQVSNWLERLRAIKRLRSKVEEELRAKNENFGYETEPIDYDDFTDYV